MSLIRFPLGRWLAALVCLFAAAAAQATIPDTYVVWPGVRVLIDDLRHRQAVIVEADLASLVESQMKPQLIEAIAQANADSEALDVKLIDVGFREWKEGSSRITLYVRVDTTGRWNVGSATLLQGSLECEVYARVEIARAPWKQIKPVDAGSSAECSSGQLPGLFVQSIEGKIRDAIVGALDKVEPISLDVMDEWAKEDPKWAEFVEPAIAHVMYCSGEGGAPALCVRLTWPNPRALSHRLNEISEHVPHPLGALTSAEVAIAKKMRKTYLRISCRENLKPSTKIANSSCYAATGKAKPGYPAERHDDGSYGDGDMTIFSGLLCLATNEKSIGCRTVRAAQGEDGRFWRSPDRVGVMDGDNASFSGDQFNGVVAYLAVSRDRKAFEGLMRYLNDPAHTKTVAGKKFYKSCLDDKNFECVLLGPEWFFLNLLADRMRTPAAFPAEMRNSSHEKFGFVPRALGWQAALAPAGYRLHLVGVQLMLMRELRWQDTAMMRGIARRLAGREPTNPFFLYLHLGKDRRVLQATNAACNPNLPQERRDDWAWQRAMSTEPWKASMGWDCYFMYRLLSS